MGVWPGAPSGQWLAHAGYAAFLPNPRGGQGHGHDFAAAVSNAVGQDEWTDILTGIDLLIAEGVADPHRLGIAGWSHGGYMAAWAIGHTNRFAAAVMGAGISDWGLQTATGEWGAFETALSGSTGWEGPGPHHHDRLSSISYAAAIRTPLLILHGADDTNVPLAQAEYLHRALRRFGVDHEFVVYPRENHSIRERHHQLDVLNRTQKLVRQMAQPFPQPAMTAPTPSSVRAADPRPTPHRARHDGPVHPTPRTHLRRSRPGRSSRPHATPAPPVIGARLPCAGFAVSSPSGRAARPRPA
jgi:dienelactone hydrolase